jgi:outer membrane protein OmpA-like peptidoglycan-associated protein
MNPFGISRRILLSILLCVASGLSAEQPKSLDIVYRSLDLKYSALGLEGGAQNVGGKGEGTGGTSSALKSEVVDLKAASAQIKAAGAEIKETAAEIKISLQGEILFDFDKSNLRPAAESTLAQVAKMIGSYPKAQVLIEGYTDSKGSDSYNAKLSDRRAVSVKTWFAKHGVAASSMQTHGWGAAKPVAPNKHPDGSDDPDGRQKNRRVEITIKK